MDPYVQAAILALLSGACLWVAFFLVVPNLPADPPQKKPPPTAAE